MATSAPRRSDAVRNNERILRGAMVQLGSDPSSGMAEIAAASGVSRATLFRHYPTRDDLIAALRTRAHAELDDAVREADLTQGSATEAMERLIDGLLEVAVQHAFLDQSGPVPGRAQRMRYVTKEVEALVRRGQQAGEFSPGAPPSWWMDVIVAVLQVAARRSGTRPEGDARELMRTTLLAGLSRG